MKRHAGRSDDTMKAAFAFVSVFLLCTATARAQIPYNEDFESDGNGSRYTLSSQFFDPANDGIFDQTTNLSHPETGTYSGQSNSGIFAAEDTDDGLGNTADEQTITVNRSIIGASDMMFDALFAGGSLSVDNDDHIIVQARIDSQAVQTLVQFESSGNLNSTAWIQDTNFDGLGDGPALGLVFQRFSAPIVGTGNNLTLTIRIEADSGFESCAIDDINLTGAAADTQVSSVNRVTASPSNALSVQWDITFADTVAGLSAANLSLVDIGNNITGESITSVVDLGAGTVWRVTASTGSGDGTLRLDVSNDSGLTPGLTNEPFTGGQTMVIDKSGPGIAISAPSTATTSGGPVIYTVSYTGASSVTLNNGHITLNSTGSASGSVKVSGSGTSSRTVTIIGITGDGTLGITVAAGSATDGVGNPAAVGPSSTFTVDNTGPAVAIGPPSIDRTKSGPVSFVVSYTGASSVTLNNGDVTLNQTGTAKGSVNVTGLGTSERTVTISGTAGTGTLGISIASGTAGDVLGNLASPGGPSTTFDVVNPDPSAFSLLCEDFETDGNGSRYLLSSQFFNLAEGIFDQTTDLSHAEDGTYTGQSGFGIFAAEDTDDTTTGGSGADEQTIIFTIPIAGATDLNFFGLFAAGDEAPASYDAVDHMIVEVQIDAQPVQTLVQFESDGILNSASLREDTDFNGTGDGTFIGLEFKPFAAQISGTGNSLTLTIRIFADSSFESMALDLIKVTSSSSEVPEIDVHDGLLITAPSIVDGGAAADFGSTSVSVGFIDRVFNIDNTTGANILNISSVFFTGINPGDFSLVGGFPTFVSPSASDTITVRFDPQSLGQRMTTLRIVNDDADEDIYDITVIGQGNPTAPEIDVHDGGMIGDPSIADGSAAAPFSFTIVAGGTTDRVFNIDNTDGSFALRISSIDFVGGDSSDFSLVGPIPTSIPAGTSDTVTVRFNPITFRLRATTLRITNNDGDEATYDVSLNGIGIVGTTFLCEDFEDNGNGVRYALSSQFFDSAQGIFDQTTDLSHPEDGTYNGQSNQGIFASEDTDDTTSGGGGAAEQTITFNVDITGATGLVFSGLFAAGDGEPASYDLTDHIFVEAQIDGGPVEALLRFESDSSTQGSRPMAQDTTGDGVGDGSVLGLAFQEFGAPIPGSGNSLTLTIRIQADSSLESLALDLLKVSGEIVIEGLGIEPLVSGPGVSPSFLGSPGVTYTIEFSVDVPSTVGFAPIGTALAAPDGVFFFDHNTASPTGFYRATLP